MWYVIERDDERKPVFVLGDNDPLNGRGNWNLRAGPFESLEEANRWAGMN